MRATLRSVIIILGLTGNFWALSAQALSPDKQITFDIPSQTFESALLQLAKQASLQLAISTPSLPQSPTPVISGKMAIREAVGRLLQDTQLSYEFVGERTLTIMARNASGEASRQNPVVTTGNGVRLARSDEQSGMMQKVQESSAADTADGHNIQEVVVTAQKREERLIDVPISLSVLSAQDIERRGLVSRADYLRSVPSVLLREDGAGLAEIVIRGAYADRFNSGPTVGLYFSDVPLTGYALGGSTDIKLIDIERVEVLRGPQGSLHGSNALSGAIRYIPKAPDLQRMEGQVSVGYSQTGGNGGSNTAVDGVINFPLVQDKLAVRAMVFRHENDGYIKNIGGQDAALQADAIQTGATALAINKDHVGSSAYSGGRISALWRPIDQFGVTLTYFTQKDSQDDRLFELQSAGRYQRSDYQFGDIIGGNKDALLIDVDILNLTAELDLGWGSVYSSSAWLDQRFLRKWDIGSLLGSPLNSAPQINTTEADVFTQEVRFTSNFDGPFGVVAGVYYEDSKTPSAQSTFFGGDPAFNPFSSVLLWQTALDRMVKQKALFGEVSYDVTEKIELTVGGRAFKYDTRFWTTFSNSVVIPNSASDDKSSESGRTSKAGIKYKASENALLYANYSQGFRLGQPLATELLRTLCDVSPADGFLDGTNVPSTLNRIDSDRLASYEVGGKVSFMGGRGNLSAAVFHNDWTDVPVVFTAPGCLQTTTINGGSARARGVETEGSFRVVDAVRVNFGFGYVDSELSSTTSLGASGDRMNFTPKFNGNLGLEYGFALFGREAFLRGDYTYFGSYYTATGEKGVRADAYSTVNLRGAVQVSERGELQVHIDNLTDSDALTSVTGPSGFPPGYGLRLAPRTVGLGLSYRF